MDHSVRQRCAEGHVLAGTGRSQGLLEASKDVKRRGQLVAVTAGAFAGVGLSSAASGRGRLIACVVLRVRSRACAHTRGEGGKHSGEHRERGVAQGVELVVFVRGVQAHKQHLRRNGVSHRLSSGGGASQ